MNTLEVCYELEIPKINFFERKVKITNKKTLIKGAFKVGKTYLIYDYLSNFNKKDYLYIDLADLRNEKISKEDLEDFLFKKEIKILVLENFENHFSLPKCQSMIISSNSIEQISNFETLQIMPLDFEEYLLQDMKNQNITQSFNNFFKYGNLADLLNFEEVKKLERLKELIKLQTKSNLELEIINLLFQNIDEKKSLYQIFNLIKAKIKVSKDKFYEICKKFESNKTIYFLSKKNQEKAVKKIYAYNFSFLKAVTYHKKFKNEFTNMIFLELINKYENLYYLDNIDFYIEKKNLAIVAIAFFNNLLLENTLKKIFKSMEKNKIKNLEIITVSNNEQIYHNFYNIRVSTFYEWALS